MLAPQCAKPVAGPAALSRHALGGARSAAPRPRTAHTRKAHNRKAELQLGWPGTEQFYADATSSAEGDASDQTWDVLGLGQAMIDFSAAVDDDTLASLQVEKGSRR
jgi:hypothetical protein